MMIGVLAFAAMIQSEPYRGELRERLEEPVISTLNSAKLSYDLEVCVADALTVLGTPTVFRSGPNDIVVAASLPSGNAYLAAVTISRVNDGSRLDLRLRGKGWDDRITARLRQCL